MSLLEVLQLVGYSMAAALSFWIGASLWKRRDKLSNIERILLALAGSMGAWHASNLAVTLHASLGLDEGRWTTLLRLADTVAVISITLTYSFLLHVHLRLRAKSRTLTRNESIRVYLFYIPAVFLVIAVPRLWSGPYAPMFEKLAYLVLPFALWATYVLCLVAINDFLRSRDSVVPGEKRLMQILAACFVIIAILILAVYGFGFGEGTTTGAYLKTLANLGSLLPTALLAYHIYRYRYLDLIVKESLIVASFAAVVLVAYLYGIRTVGEWLTANYALRAGAIESLLILSLALVAAPLRRWLDKRFHQLFKREAELYREVVARIGARGGQYQQLPDLLRYVEERTVSTLALRRLDFVVPDLSSSASDKNDEMDADNHEGDESNLREPALWHGEILRIASEQDGEPVENHPLLRANHYELAYRLRREQREVGLMLVDGEPDVLTHDVRGTLEILAGQVAIAIEDCRLVEENVRLERRLAQGERLAALGQMAATVAHEVKNPLSAIKSIAQVMREDERLCREYSLDLDLIVGETDRLNRSVTQMLNFARHTPQVDSSRRIDELIQTAVQVIKVEADSRQVSLENSLHKINVELSGAVAAALRDAVSNLLLNAVQATPAGGRVRVEARLEDGELLIAVIDSGHGVTENLRERIWEPFFTTRQRGTGLGLAIVRKRIEEVNGSVRLASSQNGTGARFELRVPLS